MPTVVVDGLSFTFPHGWEVSKYDEWAYYRNQFARMWNEIKAIDLLAVSPDQCVWFIEVKDYRQHQRTKPSDLSEEVAKKVFDSAAGVLAASKNANDLVERHVAKSACKGAVLRVVLHLEQPAKHSKLRPRAIDPAAVQQKLRRLLKPMDAHPRVVEIAKMQNLTWSVT